MKKRLARVALMAALLPIFLTFGAPALGSALPTETPVPSAVGDTIGGSLSYTNKWVSVTSLGNVPVVVTLTFDGGRWRFLKPRPPKDGWLMNEGETQTANIAGRGYTTVCAHFVLASGSGSSVTLCGNIDPAVWQ